MINTNRAPWVPYSIKVVKASKLMQYIPAYEYHMQSTLAPKVNQV